MGIILRTTIKYYHKNAIKTLGYIKQYYFELFVRDSTNNCYIM